MKSKTYKSVYVLDKLLRCVEFDELTLHTPRLERVVKDVYLKNNWLFDDF